MESAKPAERSSDTGEFVRLGPRDNFYQSCTFIPMSFALVTTVAADGQTGIGPHALCFPFNITEPYAMMLISRGTSATAANIRRTGRCALNYVEFDAERLRGITRLGYPGQSAEDKRSASPFTLIRSPSGGSISDAEAPLIISEAFQVFECTWDRSVDLSISGGEADLSSKFVLRIDHILLRQAYRDGVAAGERFPSMPIFMGFRAGGEFWFAEHTPPFAIGAPKVAGMELSSVTYLARRLDETVRFTDEACAKLTAVPRPFLQAALEKLIEAAKDKGVQLIDPAFVEDFNRNRRQS